jgi:2-succinyl-5-enolpyruvyl-6-hydroxy-3-cyclohexene-1-carboxylate synthase
VPIIFPQAQRIKPMKLIEAMKRVKANKEKIADLQQRISGVSANLSFETPLYGDQTKAKIEEWLQSCHDTTLENVRLLTAIARTNLQTTVTIKIGDNNITKSIAEWVWRRREYSGIDLVTWSKLTDRGLKEGDVQSSPGIVTSVKIIRHYDPNLRDKKIAEFRTEPHEIDAALEVVNATTDLIE